MDLYRINSQTPTLGVAKDLLGKILWFDSPDGIVSGRITETEGYLSDDPAAHSYRGETKRTAPMFRSAGLVYVYLIYGMYYCLNITTRPEGEGEAVLIRSIEPLEGVEIMLKNRPKADISSLCNGPGKLCRAFGITVELSGLNIINGAIRIYDDGYKPATITSSKRIGITQDSAKDHLYRFTID